MNSNYDTEDQKKAINVLKNLVQENAKLKEQIKTAHVFILAQLLASETGEITIASQPDIFTEDLEQTLRYAYIRIENGNNIHYNGVFQGRKVYVGKPNPGFYAGYRQLTSSEIWDEFNKHKYIEE